MALAGALIAVPATAADTAVDVAAASGTEAVTGLTNVGPSLILIALAIALIVILGFRASAKRAAKLIGAKLAKRRLRAILKQRSPNVLEDFILPGAFGGLTKIDYAILTSGGIICIQTKHYSGVVFGEADEPQWTNVDGVHQRKFLNPIIQNEGRTKALKKVVPDVPVANLIVFTGRVHFSSPLEKNVIHVRQLNSYIAKFNFGPCKVRDWDAAWMSVKAAALTDEGSRKDLGAQLSFS